jgi:hypothetical protein
MRKLNKDGSINLRTLAREISCEEGGEINQDIAQITETLSIACAKIAAFGLEAVIKTLDKEAAKAAKKAKRKEV